MLPIAERSLEVMLTGTLLAANPEATAAIPAASEALFRETADELAEIARARFQGLVHEASDVFDLMQRATPLSQLARVHFGSRPAYRQKGSGTMAGLRAIPWIFGWTQVRLMLPAWLGVGAALDTVARRPGGLATLRSMADTWPFFDDFLGKVEMVCAKADLAIARTYVESLGANVALFDELETEMTTTVQRVLEVRRAKHLLGDQPVLQAAIGLRNPYVDPLSLLQVSLLRRQRELPEDHADRDAVDQILGTTVSGIAHGLRKHRLASGPRRVVCGPSPAVGLGHLRPCRLRSPDLGS